MADQNKVTYLEGEFCVRVAAKFLMEAKTARILTNDARNNQFLTLDGAVKLILQECKLGKSSVCVYRDCISDETYKELVDCGYLIYYSGKDSDRDTITISW